MMQGKHLQEQKQASMQEANVLQQLQEEAAAQVVEEEVAGLVHLNFPHHKRESQRVATHP